MTEHFMAGAMTTGYAIAALFFLRFWFRTRDRLFLLFSLSFWLLAMQRAALGLTSESLEDQTGLYVVRLAAFVLILVAIADKNRASKTQS